MPQDPVVEQADDLTAGPFEHVVRRYCRHDGHEVDAIAPIGLGWLGLPIIAAMVIALVLLTGLSGVLVFVGLVPLAFLALAAGPMIRSLRRPPRCTECGRETPYRTREEAEHATGRPTEPADASAI